MACERLFRLKETTIKPQRLNETIASRVLFLGGGRLLFSNFGNGINHFFTVLAALPPLIKYQYVLILLFLKI